MGKPSEQEGIPNRGLPLVQVLELINAREQRAIATFFWLFVNVLLFVLI